jgi:starch synthase
MPKNNPKILFAAYECAPFYKVGGLGDVAGSLPKALKKLGADIRVVMPYYSAIKKKYPNLKKIKTIKVVVDGEKMTINIFASRLPNSTVPIYFFGHKYFSAADIFDADNRFRFALFSYLITQVEEMIGWQPDIIHLNDWHTGLVPVFLKKKNQQIKTIFTIHNLAYSGDTELVVLSRFGLVEKDFSSVKNNTVNIMREAIATSNIITTVSPTYAREILTSEFGCGLEAVLRSRKKDLFGIINGLDYEVFNPATDKNIKIRYSFQTLGRKTVNKLYLQKISHLPINKKIPLLAIVSRLAGQKGFDLLEKIITDLLQLDLQLIILGTGEARYQDFFRDIGRRYPTKVKTELIFDAKLANQIYAGADILLMPSRYEPCGLGQLTAMKYGTLPLVRATGGLKDTVIGYAGQTVGQSTGFAFRGYTPLELLNSLKQALAIFQQPEKWRKLQENAMKADFSWPHSAREYLHLYRLLA